MSGYLLYFTDKKHTMYYYSHKRLFPDNILVYIEEFNRQDKTVLFDFIDSNEYAIFTNLLNIQFDLDKPTMVLLKNYDKRRIQEDTIYSIKPSVIDRWMGQVENTNENANSFLIGYIFEVENFAEEIFGSPVAISDLYDFHLNYYMTGSGTFFENMFRYTGRISVTVRDVNQGNWNELSSDNEIKIVFDAGAPMYATRNDINRIIGNRNSLYSSSKPMLILSHWDKDHYHSLLGMSDNDLRNNFSAFICRDRVPNLTSRILFGRIKSAIGSSHVFAISARTKITKGGPTILHNMNSIKDSVVLYNAEHHKNRNISGIVLSAKSPKGSVILSGDAHYEQISRYVFPHLNFSHKHHLVVPHHGGRAGSYIYAVPHLVRLGEAIISVGKNHYGHPLSSYITLLRKSGFFVSQTNIAKKDFIIVL